MSCAWHAQGSGACVQETCVVSQRKLAYASCPFLAFSQLLLQRESLPTLLLVGFPPAFRHPRLGQPLSLSTQWGVPRVVTGSP